MENNSSIKHKVKELKEPCSNLGTFVADLRKMTVLLELKTPKMDEQACQKELATLSSSAE